jgi:hypothetical protein
MKTISLEFDNLIDPLLAVLQKDMDHITSTLGILDQLRGMVIKRDDESLNLLLEKVRLKTEKYTLVENQRQQIRRELARLWGCEPLEMTLTKLTQILAPEKSNKVKEMRNNLENLMARFKAEHLSTFMLLSECSRFNGVMLSALLNGRREETTYNRQGSMNSQSKRNIMNLQL